MEKFAKDAFLNCDVKQQGRLVSVSENNVIIFLIMVLNTFYMKKLKVFSFTLFGTARLNIAGSGLYFICVCKNVVF
jgi:hypothetical protein